MNFFHRIFAKEKNSARANNGPFFEQLEFRKSDWLDVFLSVSGRCMSFKVLSAKR